MTMVDDAVCDLGHTQDGQGWRRRRLQQVSRSDQGWRRRLPSGTSAAMSVRERLEARRRIECLLDEDRRRVAPPPEKATTPVGWLDHERRRCSLEGAATTSSFGRVDDGSKTNGMAMQPDLRSEKGKISSSIKTNLRVQSRVHQVMPPKPYPHPLVGQRTKEGAKTEGARPERPLLQLRGGPAAPGPPSQPHPRAQGGG